MPSKTVIVLANVNWCFMDWYVSLFLYFSFGMFLYFSNYVLFQPLGKRLKNAIIILRREMF